MDAKVKLEATNPITINFTSPNRFQPIRFMNNNLDLSKDIDKSEESDLHVDFQRTVWNSH